MMKNKSESKSRFSLMKEKLVKKVVLASLLCFTTFIYRAEAQTLVDFNNTSDLTDLFNPSSTPAFTNISDQGIGNTGSIDVPIGTTDIWTTKAGYSVSGEGDVYTLSAFFKIKENSGYGGLGFSANAQNEPDSYGSPEYGLGMAFHGGGGMFINNQVQTAVSWPPDLVLGNWYKMILKVTAIGSNTFDLLFQIWNSDADGVIGTMKTEQTQNGVVNAEVGSASTLHVYFSAAGSRMEKIDNFEINLEGGAVIIEEGQPVVLTDSVYSITVSTATCDGNVTDDNGTAVTEKGVCWNTTGSPITADSKTSDGTGTGPYTSSITGLSSGMTYYVRTYATNSVGTSYGNEISFSASAGMPLIASGNALLFDGTDDNVLIPNDGSQVFTNLTLEGWFKIDPAAQQYCPIITKDNNSGSFTVQLWGSEFPKSLRFYSYDGAVQHNWDFQTANIIDTNIWYHFACVFDDANDIARIYINGVEKATQSTTKPFYNSTFPISLGAYANGSCNYKGLIDDIRIWDTVRTVSEIQSDMSTGLTGSEDGLVLYYNFDASGGTTLSDIASDPVSSDGTLNNMVGDEWTVSYAMNNPISSEATNIGSASFTAIWNHPAQGIAEKYFLYVSNSSDFSSYEGVFDGYDAGIDTSVSVTGLTNGTEYYYRVLSYNSAKGGNGSYSNEQVVVTMLDQTITFEELSDKTYGDDDFDPGATASSDLTVTYSSSDTLVANIVGGIIHITGAGTSTITASQSGDETYGAAIDIEQPLTVNKAGLTVTAEDKSKTYGDLNPVLTVTYTGFVGTDNEDSLTIAPTATTIATQYSDADTYSIVPAEGAAVNYTFAYVNGTLGINKASLNITANDESREEGEANPIFTLSYSDFIGTDDATVIDVLPTASCVANVSSATGDYDIVLTDGSDNNYDLILHNGVLTVTPATAISIANADAISVYPNPAGSYIYINNLPEKAEVLFFNLKGELVKNVIIIGTEKIDINDLSSGVYIIKISGKENEIVARLIKQ
jgi:hypothetical protein